MTPGPKFRPEASFGLENSGTDAENREESENATENYPKPPKHIKLQTRKMASTVVHAHVPASSGSTGMASQGSSVAGASFGDTNGVGGVGAALAVVTSTAGTGTSTSPGRGAALQDGVLGAVVLTSLGKPLVSHWVAPCSLRVPQLCTFLAGLRQFCARYVFVPLHARLHTPSHAG